MKIFSLTETSPSEFVAFWSARYRYNGENLYDKNIRDPGASYTEGQVWRLSMVKQQSAASAGGPTVVTTTAGPKKEEPKPGYDTTGMPPEAAYIFDLANKSRARLSARYRVVDTKRDVGIVEFVQSQTHVLDRLTTDELRALGLVVAFRDYGVRVTWEKTTFVATEWPLDQPQRVSDADNRRIDAVPERSSI